MRNQRTINGNVACNYLEKYRNLPTRSIARMLCKQEPVLFPDLENCRRMLRQYRGAAGDFKRGLNYAAKQFYRPPGNQNDGHIPLPEPIEQLPNWKVQLLWFKRALVISDIHIPFHDKQALTVALAHGKKLGVDCIILDGDVMDFHAVSFWDKDPRHRELENELEMGRLFLESLRDRFPKARIIYKEGNHEERLWRHAIRQSPELYNVTGPAGERVLGLGNVLHLAEYDIELVDNKQPLLCGEHLYILHGHEFRAPFVNPVNPARGLFLRAKANALCGDLHQTSTHSEAGIERVMSCFSIGALCQLRAAYCPINKWNHGFGVVHLTGKEWKVDNHKIINGVVV
jgi:predicted phosphodiesterase